MTEEFEEQSEENKRIYTRAVLDLAKLRRPEGHPTTEKIGFNVMELKAVNRDKYKYVDTFKGLMNTMNITKRRKAKKIRRNTNHREKNTPPPSKKRKRDQREWENTASSKVEPAQNLDEPVPKDICNDPAPVSSIAPIFTLPRIRDNISNCPRSKLIKSTVKRLEKLTHQISVCN